MVNWLEEEEMETAQLVRVQEEEISQKRNADLQALWESLDRVYGQLCQQEDALILCMSREMRKRGIWVGADE